MHDVIDCNFDLMTVAGGPRGFCRAAFSSCHDAKTKWAEMKDKEAAEKKQTPIDISSAFDWGGNNGACGSR